MKNQKTKLIKITLLFVFSYLIFFGCKNEYSQLFQNMNCNDGVIREHYVDIENENGELLYLQSKEKYAIKHAAETGNIDNVAYFVLCEKPSGINENDSVIFSCESYRFNDNEGYLSSVGGEEFYFSTSIKITKL